MAFRYLSTRAFYITEITSHHVQCPSHFFHVIEHCKCFPVSLIFFSKLTLVAELPVVAQGGLSASRASFSPGSPSGRAGEPPRWANLPPPLQSRAQKHVQLFTDVFVADLYGPTVRARRLPSAANGECQRN